MATPTPKRTAPAAQAPTARLVVDPRWLAWALFLVLLAASILAYLSVCLLIYQGGWQFTLHPSPKVDKTPTTAFQPIRFDAAATGTPRLAGWWLPAESGPAPTILFLHGGSGSLANSVPILDLLHQANVNIFAFDYRGFGQSAGPHPTQARMNEDAAAALRYLVDTRHIPAAQIVPYGEGLGADIAATLAAPHPDLPALILDTPDPSAFARAALTQRSRLLPMRSLISDQFDIAQDMRAALQPKLLLADSPFGFESERVRENQRLFRSVTGPKLTVTFDSPYSAPAYLDSVRRFLDQYVPRPIPSLSAKP